MVRPTNNDATRYKLTQALMIKIKASKWVNCALGLGIQVNASLLSI